MCQLCEVENTLSVHAKSKRNFLKSMSGLGLAGLAPNYALGVVSSTPRKPESVFTPNAALERLMAGNERYTRGTSHPFEFIHDQQALAGEQHPFATIVTCADARVMPELCFDEQRAGLFMTRVAGNYASAEILPSLEYAALILKVPLIMVLGHQDCGAVKAAMESVEKHAHFPAHIQAMATAIAPAVRATQKQTGNRYDNVIRENVILNVKRLKHTAPAISELVTKKKVKVVGGVYSLRTGRVELVT